MPELPEVELVSRFLEKIVTGRKIDHVVLLRPRLAPHSSPDDFAAQLSGARIYRIRRRGKHILIDLDNGRTLIAHLRMSGRFALLSPEAGDLKFTHAEFRLAGGDRLVFADQRHFGFMRVVSTETSMEAPEIKCLAPEPFSDDFSNDYLYGTLHRCRRTVKEFLVDQKRVCGLGNIYAAEALFLAGIHPAKRTHTISHVRSDLLRQKILFVLNEAVDAGSTLNADPTDSDSAYYGGEYEEYWRVYDREGMPCTVCETPIVRSKHGARSTFYCPECQRR